VERLKMLPSVSQLRWSSQFAAFVKAYHEHIGTLPLDALADD
jgi:hypothetical protein